MNTVLNVAANVVAFNADLHMLRSDTSPAQKRIKRFGESMPNVTFHACNTTIQGMTKKEGKEPPILRAVEIVPAGVVTLMELNEAG
jgi:intracellular sulfur oxidation DsrE/DsrF family protein